LSLENLKLDEENKQLRDYLRDLENKVNVLDMRVKSYEKKYKKER